MTRPKLRTILSTSITALFVAFGAAMLALVVPSGGWKALSVQTGSMRPAINPGDLVLVHHIPASEYQIGDVITYINPDNKDQTITHRIVDKSDKGKHVVLETKGDANDSADRPINDSVVIGRQVFNIPYLGRVMDFMHTIPGLLLIIYVPAFVIIFGETKRLAAYYRKFVPYLDPTLKSSHLHPVATSDDHSHIAFVAAAGVLLMTLGLASPVFAATVSSARLSSNTITIAAEAPEAPSGGNTTTCNSSTNISIHTQTNQHAQSGDATVQNDTNGGSATSGAANNSNVTTINGSITNSCHKTQNGTGQ